MNNVFYIGATGLRAQQTALDVVGNNIANMNTAAFKRGEVAFVELVAPAAPASPGAGKVAERGIGVAAAASPKVFEQGELRQTGKELDLAVRGAGFIELLGPGGQALLWRGGGLRVNHDGMLAAANGLPLKGAISVPHETTALTITETGQVLAQTAGRKGAREIGRIDLVSVGDARALASEGDGVYRIGDETADISHGRPGDNGLGLLAQGYSEASNVKLADEMVNMLLMQRAYAANARLIQAGDEMMSLVNDLRR